MKVLVFSDVHGNLPAFEIMLKRAGKVDHYLSLGDVVNYGPWSNECVDLLETLAPATKILGNHDSFFIQGEVPQSTSELCQAAFRINYPEFQRSDILKKYQQETRLADFLCVHTLNNRYVYADSQIELKENIFLGHSHRQFTINNSGYRLINPGSVGQNREALGYIDFALWDTKRGRVDFQHLTYDTSPLIQKMTAKKFPPQLIAYY